METTPAATLEPTPAFIGASWAALFVGAGAYLIGLFNASMPLHEKGYYLVLLLFGLFASVSVQKSVRDRIEGLQVTNLYYGLSWMAVASAITLVTIGLWNASLADSEKGFFGMAFTLALFASVAVQKNVRDMAAAQRANGVTESGADDEASVGAEGPRGWSFPGRGE